MGTRIAAAAWGSGSVNDISQYAKSFLTERVLKAIVEEKFESLDKEDREIMILMIIIHMDEYQCYVKELYEHFGGKDDDDSVDKARKCSHEMTKCIRSFMHTSANDSDKFLILPICT